MDILICRLKPWMAVKVARNLTEKGHSVHSIDHGQLDEYVQSNSFKSCHLWRSLSTPVDELEDQFRRILLEQNIGLVIITQKLFLYSNVAEKVCRDLGIRVVFTEYFFDDKLIFDDVGMQYTEKSMKLGLCDLPIDTPRADREAQPSDMTQESVFAKYSIPYGKIVVVYGQVLWDMSLVRSPQGMTYDEYLEGLCSSNPDTTFLFKPHPKDHYGSPNSTKYSFPNMIRVNESLRTLFLFDAHTAYSSTVIFEGVMAGKRFASVGYHFFDQHTHRIERGQFDDIYRKIMFLRYNKERIRREASYITNLYALDMADPRLIERLLCTGDISARISRARVAVNG